MCGWTGAQRARNERVTARRGRYVRAEAVCTARELPRRPVSQRLLAAGTDARTGGTAILVQHAHARRSRKYVYHPGAGGHSAWIWPIRNCFSSVNCSSARAHARQRRRGAGRTRRDVPSLSLWKSRRNVSSLSLLRRRIAPICGGLFGFATNTCSGASEAGRGKRGTGRWAAAGTSSSSERSPGLGGGRRRRARWGGIRDRGAGDAP